MRNTIAISKRRIKLVKARAQTKAPLQPGCCTSAAADVGSNGKETASAGSSGTTGTIDASTLLRNPSVAGARGRVCAEAIPHATVTAKKNRTRWERNLASILYMIHPMNQSSIFAELPGLPTRSGGTFRSPSESRAADLEFIPDSVVPCIREEVSAFCGQNLRPRSGVVNPFKARGLEESIVGWPPQGPYQLTRSWGITT